ncbi:MULTISPECIES: murein L,D-transpeptidase catalytic domain family protein [Niastella]|uniref:Murein L,D-transpeptidase catalytic domain family protein n=1 Tax=Niastella soli TaxID=2821487 RepID=A0ABS3YQA8_9BACT|nr:murein L,D-transpeptidase catalytic domain family protein [Niastella soli]MBO9199615.1 murein L,D-transpeptidase catalytic domain family protein [Niastella soli]
MAKSNYPKFKAFIFIPLLLLVVVCFMYAAPASDFLNNKKANTAILVKDSTMSESHVSEAFRRLSSLYGQIKLDSLGLTQTAFDYALQGYIDLVSNGAIKNDHILSIVDFSLPSTKRRLFVIDVTTGKLLFNTYVSHGRNSGKEMATEFSNDANSFKSSLGFYVTGTTYSGEHGFSLRLDGKEPGINDNAYSRSIVMHAANYVNENIIKAKGVLGRSLGCPAVPPSLHKAIINTIKDGSCLFLYSPDSFYVSHSKMINQQVLTQQPVITG